MKITIIGAGSVRYALKLIGDLAKSPDLVGGRPELCLMDIHSQRLEAAHLLASRYLEELDVPVRINSTENLDTAVDGANYVINTILAFPVWKDQDGFASWEAMTAVGEQFGYYRGVDSQEYNMVSTYTYGLCSYYDMQAALNIARSMERLSPQGTILQTGNPVFEISQLLNRITSIQTIGFCHGHGGVHEVCKPLGLPFDKVDWQVAGVNHGIWLNRFRYNGMDAYPLLDRWIAQELPSWQSSGPWDIQMSPAVMDMYGFYGLLPIGDTCRNGSWKYNYNLETKRQWFGSFGSIDNEIERPKLHRGLRKVKEQLLAIAQEVRQDKTLRITERWPDIFTKGDLSGEQQILYIQARETNRSSRLVLNLPNQGTIYGIPDDVVVEIPVLVDRSGIHRETIEPELPRRLINMYLMPRILRMEWSLEAFISRDRRVLEEILLHDQRTRSYKQVKDVWDAIFALPYHEDLRRYFTPGSAS
ncbi:alpha-glucosidase/alpha-galactosidase [Gracilinema caldarium]|uniref:family 4 glycosyl hydrolase n=1 Tax=Gracilinema caldarium TaxID=215591 RepID=UPI0026EDD7DE|nr:alpha-glucosidase/alpha-galactosidase [Gracilinema caldarium]